MRKVVPCHNVFIKIHVHAGECWCKKLFWTYFISDLRSVIRLDKLPLLQEKFKCGQTGNLRYTVYVEGRTINATPEYVLSTDGVHDMLFHPSNASLWIKHSKKSNDSLHNVTRACNDYMADNGNQNWTVAVFVVVLLDVHRKPYNYFTAATDGSESTDTCRRQTCCNEGQKLNIYMIRAFLSLVVLVLRRMRVDFTHILQGYFTGTGTPVSVK